MFKPLNMVECVILTAREVPVDGVLVLRLNRIKYRERLIKPPPCGHLGPMHLPIGSPLDARLSNLGSMIDTPLLDPNSKYLSNDPLFIRYQKTRILINDLRKK